MSFGSLKDLYLDELGDLYAAEMQMIRALPRLVDETRAPKLRDLLSKHCEESRLHLERLQLIFTHWGQRVPSSTCAGIAGIVQEADERLTQLTTDDVRMRRSSGLPNASNTTRSRRTGAPAPTPAGSAETTTRACCRKRSKRKDEPITD